MIIYKTLHCIIQLLSAVTTSVIIVGGSSSFAFVLPVPAVHRTPTHTPQQALVPNRNIFILLRRFPI